MENKFKPLSKNENEELRSRILRSVDSYKKQQRRKRFMYAAASVIVIALGLNLYLTDTNKVASIEQYANNSINVQLDSIKDITLILNNESKLNFKQDQTSISYSPDGQAIKIGDENEISQSKKSKLSYNTIIVPFGKRVDLTLADGSKVWLNSGTKFTYPSFFDGDKRSVYLNGEAIFDVAHDKTKPFKVISKLQEIEVLGTVFQVSVYEGDDLMQTALKSGSVALNFRGNNVSTTLKPGMVSTLDVSKGKIDVVHHQDVESFFTWKEGYLKLESDTLKSIMSKLSHYYNKEIVIEDENLANQLFSGRLDLKGSIDEVLNTVNISAKFKVEIGEKQIKLKNNN